MFYFFAGKKFLKAAASMMLCCGVIAALSACAANSGKKGVDSNAASVSEDEAKAIVADLIPKAEVFYRSVFNGYGYFKDDPSAAMPGSEREDGSFPYVLVVDDKVKSLAGLKAMTEEVFTPEAADKAFYSHFLAGVDKPLSEFDYHDYTPMYYEYDGRLYVDSGNGGKGFAFEWDFSSTKIDAIDSVGFAAKIERTLFDEPDGTTTVRIENRNGLWLVANDFVNENAE